MPLRSQGLKVYLSGPIEYAPDNGVDWRAKAETSLTAAGFRVFNPTTHSNEILKLTGNNLNVQSYNELKKTINSNWADFRVYRDATRAFIDFDVRELRNSDIVLVKVNSTASGGTAGELTLANYLSIPIVGFCDEDVSKVSGWVIGMIDQIFCHNWGISTRDTVLETAINFVKKSGPDLVQTKEHLRGAWVS